MKYLLLFLGIGSFLFPSVVAAYSSVTTTSQGSSTTDITIEVNGEKKTFHAQGDEDINWESEDGKSSVKVNSNAGTATTSTPKPETTPKPTNVKEAIKKEINTTQKNIVAIIIGEIQKIRVSIFESIKSSIHF